MASENYLIVSDTQIPYEADRALEFVTYLKRHFKIADENCYHAGDEIDSYWGSLYKKHADSKHTAVTELQAARESLKHWYRAFPQMKLAISNHGLRWVRKAVDAEIPTQLLRSYREIIQAPEGWQWKNEWVIEGSRHRFRLIHGMGYSGARGHINAAIDGRISTAIGHLHSHAGVNHMNFLGSNGPIWSMNTGCLIDTEALAFAYGKENRYQPVLGCGVVLDGGKMPIFVPYG